MASNDTATPDQTGNNETPPPNRPAGELAWILQGLNRLEEKFDKLDERLRTVENKIVLLVLLQVLLRLFNVSISLK